MCLLVMCLYSACLQQDDRFVKGTSILKENFYIQANNQNRESVERYVARKDIPSALQFARQDALKSMEEKKEPNDYLRLLFFHANHIPVTLQLLFNQSSPQKASMACFVYSYLLKELKVGLMNIVQKDQEMERYLKGKIKLPILSPTDADICAYWCAWHLTRDERNKYRGYFQRNEQTTTN